MTIEEAKKELEFLKHEVWWLDCDQPVKEGYWEAVRFATRLCEKQIPMKPLHTHRNYYCPICGEDGWMLWDDAIPNELDSFCGKCGQRLDWSDINDD